MNSLFSTKIIQIGTSKGLVIPVEILRALQLDRGDLMVFAVYSEGQFICRKLSPVEIENLKPQQLIID